jgi:hypothetical protein
MLPLPIPPAQVQEAPGPPPGLELPPTLQWKPGSLELWPFDDESFEIRSSREKGPVRITIEGRVWRFSLVSTEGRFGYLTLIQRLKPVLEAAGWVWQFEERGVARREIGAQELWLRAASGGSGELKMVVVERRAPRDFEIPRPGKTPELPGPQEDFPYLPPWPGSKLTRCADAPSRVPVELTPGNPGVAMVNSIEKEYELMAPVSAHEFLTVYSRALMNAGWEIEGRFRGQLNQIQAVYTRDGREIRATLKLQTTSMILAVADVGAQRPK